MDDWERGKRHSDGLSIVTDYKGQYNNFEGGEGGNNKEEGRKKYAFGWTSLVGQWIFCLEDRPAPRRGH